MIELSKHERGTVDTFMDDIVKVPEVRFAFLVTGRYDLVVHVVVRDTQHLKDLALDQFTNRPGVTRIETSIIFDARRRYELPVFQVAECALDDVRACYSFKWWSGSGAPDLTRWIAKLLRMSRTPGSFNNVPVRKCS